MGYTLVVIKMSKLLLDLAYIFERIYTNNLDESLVMWLLMKSLETIAMLLV